MIKRHTKLLLAPTVVILTGLALFLVLSRQSTVVPKQWLLVSAPVFGSRITLTGAVPTVSLVISNVGPRTIEPSLSWFECRTKTEVAGMEDSQGWRSLPSLLPRKASKVVCDLPQSFTAGEAPLFCCEITWFERESFIRRKANALAAAYPSIWPWNLDWVRLWQSKPRNYGVAFASNVAAADYFRSVYGMDEAYFERKMLEFKALSTVRRGASDDGGMGFRRILTQDEKRTNNAWSLYLNFRQSM